MKKLLTLIITAILCFGLTNNLFAALDADTVWEVRTTGADTNGGGFNSTNAAPGTDYSQQNAAQVSSTDLACSDHVTFVCTSASGGFTGTAGNLIQINDTGDTAHFVVGFYEIVSVTNDTTVVLDRDPTDGNNETGGDFKLGGALATPGKSATVVVAGNKVYIKAGTYQKYGANDYIMSLSTAGTAGNPVIFEGYQTTRGDTPTGSSRPVFDGDSGGANAVTNCVLLNNIDIQIFRNLIFQKATGIGVDGSGGEDNGCFQNCRFTNNGGDGLDSWKGVLHKCEFDLNAIGADDIFSDGNELSFNYFHDNSSLGCDTNNIEAAVGNVFDTNGGGGFTTAFGGLIMNNIAYNNTGVGFELDRTTKGIVVNNISVSNSTYGFQIDAGYMAAFFDYNLYQGNGTAGLNRLTAGSNDVTSDPSFTNAAAGDFTVQSGSPVLDAGSQPGTDVGLTGDYKWNIGVDQDDNAAGGSSEHSYGFVN